MEKTIVPGVEVRMDIEENNGTVMGDADQLKQMVVHLCTNAAQAMEESGGLLAVGLTTIRIDKAALPYYPDLESGLFVQLLVHDTGQGIGNGIQHRIFDPYFTTKDAGNGTGFGLAFVRRVIHQHHGTISVYSEPGCGTRVKVLLPRV